MTALLIIAALFGGLCFAGRRWRQYYVDQYIDNDVDTVCDGGCDEGCASESYDNSSSSGDRDD